MSGALFTVSPAPLERLPAHRATTQFDPSGKMGT
ncbi:hypothetical protein SAMN04489717_4328 [Actinopolymorpha singaporensis]|uniref:Uncharacterized protein n=1 Tax=Actinopolymorpha singaporensis TaxID=117157 RepID=A0A1H1W3F8_9ACTN|nr:hypothetical protein SAMN04489717_4328 [Actinopolymorpha singaporensis]